MRTKRKIIKQYMKNYFFSQKEHKKKYIALLLKILLIWLINQFNIMNKDKGQKIINFTGIKNISYDETGEMLFSKNNVLSFNKLNEYYYGQKENYSKFNHIHILFAFNDPYYLLSSITISSILKTANLDSYIHIHIFASKGFRFDTMKKLESLKTKINNNTEFIFYNVTRAEEDFGAHIKFEKYSSGEYAKLLGAELIDSNIDRIIVLDSGDILVQKDLLELYNYPLEDYLVRGVEDPFSLCFTKYNYFFNKEGYINGGVVFYNLKKWREMNIYQDIIKFYKSFNFTSKLPTAHQDILNGFLPSSSIGILPLKYNYGEYYNLNKTKDEQIDSGLYKKKCSFFYGKEDIVFEADKNVVIRHYNKHKIHYGKWNSIMTKQWQYYAKMTGFYDDICKKYPLGCK